VFDEGEENSLNKEQEKASSGHPSRGRPTEFTSAGALVRIIDDDGRLNAPWGVALAPADFGPMSGQLLVSNFGGAGRIAAFDDATGKFTDYLRDEQGAPIGTFRRIAGGPVAGPGRYHRSVAVSLSRCLRHNQCTPNATTAAVTARSTVVRYR
jgi:YD repeat-containing protein